MQVHRHRNRPFLPVLARRTRTRVRVLRARTGGFSTPVLSSNLASVKLYNLDHVGIAVKDLDAAIAGYFDRYGVEPIHRQVVADQGVDEAMIPIGGSFVQLLGALSPETPVGRFLETRGEGLHHVAYAVLDIEESLAHLAAKGARLIDEFPRVGGSGARIAFVHPSDLGGTLIELVEHPGG